MSAPVVPLNTTPLRKTSGRPSSSRSTIVGEVHHPPLTLYGAPALFERHHTLHAPGIDCLNATSPPPAAIAMISASPSLSRSAIAGELDATRGCAPIVACSAQVRPSSTRRTPV